MKGLALETIVKMGILLVTAFVIILLIMTFSDDIKFFLNDLFSKEKQYETQRIEAVQFSTGQIIAYIKSCWSKTGDQYRKDFVCFVLKGDISSVQTSSLINVLDPPASVDVSNFNIFGTTTIVRYQYLDRKIIVES